MVATISADGLVKRYGEQAALDGFDLEVERGTVFGLTRGTTATRHRRRWRPPLRVEGRSRSTPLTPHGEGEILGAPTRRWSQ